MKRKSLFGGLSAILMAIGAYFGLHTAPTPSTKPIPVDSTAVPAPPPKPVPETTITPKPVPPPVVTPAPPPVKPAPPPVVTPPPVVAPPATALSGLQVLGEDYTSYKSDSAFHARISRNINGGTGTSNLLYTDGANAHLAALDTTVRYNGHATAKYNQPGGIASSPELWVGLSKPLSHVWIRAHIRFSPGYITTGTTNSANAYKLLGWAYAGTDGSGRLEITNTTQYDFYWGTTSRATNTTSGGGEHTNAGQISTEWSDGAWYTYILEIDNTQKTGVTRFYWARGNGRPTLRGTTTGTMLDGSLVPPVPYVNLGMNFNQVRKADQHQALWYGDWEIVDGVLHTNPFGL